jgi:hypothetical protein
MIDDWYAFHGNPEGKTRRGFNKPTFELDVDAITASCTSPEINTTLTSCNSIEVILIRLRRVRDNNLNQSPKSPQESYLARKSRNLAHNNERRGERYFASLPPKPKRIKYY